MKSSYFDLVKKFQDMLSFEKKPVIDKFCQFVNDGLLLLY